MKRIGINSGRTDGDTIIRLLLLDSILVEFYTRFTSKWDYQWEHLEWKKKKKREGEGKKKRKLTAANSVAVIVGENRFQLGDR